MPPSHIFVVRLSSRVGGQRQCVPTCFLVSSLESFAISFLQFNSGYDLIPFISDMHSWLSGQSVALSKQEIASSTPNSALLLIFALLARARQLFLNLRKPIPFFSVVMVACLQEGNFACPTLYKEWNTRPGVWTWASCQCCVLQVLPTFQVSLFKQAQFKRLGNCNVNGKLEWWFKCKHLFLQPWILAKCIGSAGHNDFG